MAARLTGMNGPSLRSDSPVNQPREQLLAGAALAEDQHRCRQPRDALDGVHHQAHRLARSGDELALALSATCADSVMTRRLRSWRSEALRTSDRSVS